MKTIGNFITISGVVLATTFGFGSSSLAQPGIPVQDEDRIIENQCMSLCQQLGVMDALDLRICSINCIVGYADNRLQQHQQEMDQLMDQLGIPILRPDTSQQHQQWLDNLERDKQACESRGGVLGSDRVCRHF